MWTSCQRTAQRPVANANAGCAYLKSLLQLIFSASGIELNKNDFFYQSGFQSSLWREEFPTPS